MYGWKAEMVFVRNTLRPLIHLLVRLQIMPGLATVVIKQSPSRVISLFIHV